jgi:hypothetical protein
LRLGTQAASRDAARRRISLLRKIFMERLGSRFKVQGSRFKVQGLRFKVQGSRFKVQGSKFKVHGSKFKVQGSKFKDSWLDEF